MGERVEFGEPIPRLWEHQFECRARWHHPGTGPWDNVWLSVGTLADGRWYVDHTQQGTRAYQSKGDAWTVARNWMARRDGEWEQVPCYPTQQQRG